MGSQARAMILRNEFILTWEGSLSRRHPVSGERLLQHKKLAFTLVEMLLVLVLLAILTTSIAVSLGGRQDLHVLQWMESPFLQPGLETFKNKFSHVFRVIKFVDHIPLILGWLSNYFPR